MSPYNVHSMMMVVLAHLQFLLLHLLPSLIYLFFRRTSNIDKYLVTFGKYSTTICMKKNMVPIRLLGSVHSHIP